MKTNHLESMPEGMRPASLVFAALGEPTRQKILLLFQKDEEISIKTIVELLPLSRTSIVHHLDVLERAGILVSRREGKSSLYHAKPETVMTALNALGEYIREEFYDA